MLSQFFVSVITILVMVHLILLSCAYLIFLERKVAAWVQDRIGPNRTNFGFGLVNFKSRHFGLGQALADGLKLLFKEDYTPPNVDRILFILAPAIIIIPAILSWAIIPWGGKIYIDPFTISSWVPFFGGESSEASIALVAGASINIGIIYILAIGSLGVYGVVVGGYASNNKYSFLGGLRATAQMLSYEIPQALCVLIIILVSGTSRPDVIIDQQVATTWNIVFHPFMAIIFFTCILAECNRAPFDLAEAEQELVGGYHTEYSSMKWALFFLGEYMHMITGSAFFVLLFLGGWDVLPISVLDLPIVAEGSIPYLILIVAIKAGVFFAKVAFLLFVMMWIRWTLPRFRFDQLMQLAWRALIPVMLFILLATGIAVFYGAPPAAYTGINILAVILTLVVGPLLPAGPPTNRRVPLEGSRFNPPVKA
jgi:NADH-quinone oxidoreductase subunit H